MMIGAVQCRMLNHHFDSILSPQYSKQRAGHSYFDAAQATSLHVMIRGRVSSGRERSLVYRAVDLNRKMMMIGAVQCRMLNHHFDSILSPQYSRLVIPILVHHRPRPGTP